MTLTRRTALLAGLATLAGCSAAGYRGPEREVVIAAGESGGFYLAFAELLAQQLNRAEPRLRATAVATEASVENLRRLRDGRADLGLVLGDVAESAFAERRAVLRADRVLRHRPCLRELPPARRPGGRRSAVARRPGRAAGGDGRERIRRRGVQHAPLRPRRGTGEGQEPPPG